MSTPQTFIDFVNIVITLLKAVLPVLMGMAVLAFFWGLAKFIFRVGGDEKAVHDGKNFMIWGVIAMFILISVWGILAFAYNEFGFNLPFGFPQLPQS